MITNTKILPMRDDVQIYSEILESDKDTWLIATHGIGEHLGRHKYLSSLFSETHNIFQYDLRGHGKSSGKRAYVESFSDYIKDLQEIVNFLRDNYRMKKFVLFGHSMGALITASFIQNYKDENFYPERVLINAPPVGMDGLLGKILDIIPQNVFEFIGKLPYSVAISGLVDLNYLSHDPTVKELYLTDNLNSTRIHSRLLLELVSESKKTFSRPLRCRTKGFVSVGTEDRVVGHGALVDFFTKTDKSFALKTFDGAYHEIHNEIEKYRLPYFEYLRQAMLQ